MTACITNYYLDFPLTKEERICIPKILFCFICGKIHNSLNEHPNHYCHCCLKQHKLRRNEFNNYIHDIPYFHNDNFADDVFDPTFETFGSSLNDLFRSNNHRFIQPRQSNILSIIRFAFKSKHTSINKETINKNKYYKKDKTTRTYELATTHIQCVVLN